MAKPGTLREDHVVETADGTRCRVRYVQPAHDGRPELAELRPLEGGDGLTLPTAELRRVPDPARQRPPISGLPAERPRCACCDKLLRPLTNDTWDNGRQVMTARTFRKWSAYYGLFCTLSCAAAFAAAAYKAGYRITRRPASSTATTKGSTQ